MILYSIIMLLVSVLFFCLGFAIYRGKTGLIHDYHQTKVKDKAAYGKAFGKAMFVIAVGMLGSGIISLFGETKTIGMISMAALFLGLVIGIILIAVVQKKYNNGIF